MATEFSRTLSLLRKERGVSQRVAAADLGVSQALLSHYENGIREPGLAFVVKACAYYHVSADFLLGRTLNRDGSIIGAEDVYDSSGEKGSLRGSILATLQKKLVVNTTGVLFELLGKTGDREAITAAKGRNAKAISALLDVEKLKKSTNQDADIKDALEALKKDNAYLFEDDSTPPPYAGGTGRSTPPSKYDAETAKIMAAAGLDPEKD